jgi:hypothetical protein
MTRWVPRVTPRAGPPRQDRVALPAGAEALPPHGQHHLPAQTLVRESLPAPASRWDTAHVVLGATHPHRPAWVRSALEPLVAGPTEAGLTALAAAANAPLGTATPRHAVRRPVGYDRRHPRERHDDEDLARGGPLGTGVIAGACGPVVQDRLAQSGRRWTNAGAQAVLDRRAVRRKRPWEPSWPFHRQQPPQRLSGSSAPVPDRREDLAIEWAA